MAYAGTEEAYNYYIKDYVADWAVSQPTNAEENHLCYYAKDYIKGTNKLRALFIDYNDWRAHGSGSDYHQAVWVADQLADALTEGMSVVIFTHDVPGIETQQNQIRKYSIKTPYTFFSTYGTYEYTDTNYVKLAELVYDFQKEGGEFVGYVTGHNHNGGIGYIAGRLDAEKYIAPYTQMYYCGAYANVRLRSDSSTFTKVLRDPYTRSHDMFRILSVDVYGKMVKILNFGAQINYKGQYRGIVAMKYNTQAYEPFDENEIYTKGDIYASEQDNRLYKFLLVTTKTEEGASKTDLEHSVVEEYIPDVVISD